MSEHIALIGKKLEHLGRMREYLSYSVDQVRQLLPIHDWARLSPDQLMDFCRKTYPLSVRMPQ